MTEALCILGGGLKKNANGVWHTLDFGEGEDDFGEMCDKWRVIAGSILWKESQERIIIASGAGHKKKLAKFFLAPTVAEIIKKELLDLGVPEGKIYKEEKSNTTYGQLFYLPQIFKEKEITKAYLVSNEWHLPRIKMFLEHGPDIKELWNGYEIELVSAEEVLLTEDKGKWRDIIEKARKSEGIQKRIDIETEGIGAIYNGKYVYKK